MLKIFSTTKAKYITTVTNRFHQTTYGITRKKRNKKTTIFCVTFADRSILWHCRVDAVQAHSSCDIVHTT